LYAAVEGHSPYEQRTNPVAVLHDITQGQPPHPQRADFLEPALQRMMDRDPSSRWSMDDAAHVLRRLADQHKPESTLVNTLSGGAPAPAREVAREEPSRSTTATAPRPRPTPVESPPRASAAPVQSVASPTKRPRRRGPARLVVAAVVLLLVLGGVAWYVAQLGDGQQQAGDTAGQGADKSGDKTGDKAGKASSSSSSTNEDQSSDTTAASPAEEKEQFVRSYYEKAPGGSDEAWAMLGPTLKEQGRASYNGFWRGIESVEVQSAKAKGNTVDVTLVYTRTNGETSTERKQESLVSDGNGGYLLDTDQPG
jgi:hypothetical protein